LIGTVLYIVHEECWRIHQETKQISKHNLCYNWSWLIPDLLFLCAPNDPQATKGHKANKNIRGKA
jgi:hypothetical protein